ncbi:MAG: beta-galactosidase [Thermogutta sp.]|uniref:GH39 family glycosyl hydrolase n=1 Tax=Thermogutta sp. TaxID=1962930 RepID=UPI0019B76B86|nr:beta-galactosidase [Thermogutta sp.]MBC7351744.1 beta-galactosidase [Thermogutta sp.]
MPGNNRQRTVGRRSFLRRIGLTAMALPAGRLLADDSATVATSSDWVEQYNLARLGALKTKPSREIAKSRIGVGMECLDRRMFLPEKTYGPLAELGVKWARLQTGWSRCERKEGEYDFQWLDDVVDHVIDAGVQPWFNVGYGNRLYSPDAPHESAVGQVPIYGGERGINGWKNFLRALAERYKDRVEYWEIWNEPNIPAFWHPKHKPSPVEYTKLVAISAEAIRERHPGAKIVACSSGIPSAFIKGCLQAGMGPLIQAFSIHPYRREMIPEMDYALSVSRVKELFRVSAPHVRLWQGECGAPSRNTGHHDASWMDLWNMNEMNQAKWLVRRLMLDVYLDMDVAQYFHLCDLMESTYRQASGEARPPVMLGLLNGKTYTPKRSYHAMQHIATLFDAQTRPEPGGYCAMSPRKSTDTLREPFMMLFRRRDTPMLAYYQAVNVQDDSPAVPVDVTLYCDSQRRTAEQILPDPVLVDPITGEIYKVSAMQGVRQPGEYRAKFRFRNLPCLDYPLIITSKSSTL